MLGLAMFIGIGSAAGAATLDLGRIDGSSPDSADALSHRDPGSTPGRSTHCKHARRGTWFYLNRANDHRATRRVRSLALARPIRETGCPYERWRSGKWRTRSRAERRQTERWIARHVLHDFRVSPGANAWLRAVDEVQKVYPGTRSWLRSCSAAEGGWGRFVVFGGGSYYSGAEHARNHTGHVEVFGPMQYTWGTFRDHSWNARVDAARRGFIVPASAARWDSALGQALAAGWAKFKDKDYRHWEASWTTGCWP